MDVRGSCLQVLHMDLVTDEIIQNIIFIAHAIWQCLLLILLIFLDIDIFEV